MSYGFRSINDSSKVQIDETYHNYCIHSMITIGAAGTFTAPSISGILVFIRAPSQNVFVYSHVGLSYTVRGITSSATILFMTRTDQYTLSGASTYGLKVFNALGEQSFDSRYPYAGVISTNLYSRAYTTPITVSTSKTVFVDINCLTLCFFSEVAHVSGTKYYFAVNIVGNVVTFSQQIGFQRGSGAANSYSYAIGDYRNVTFIGVNI